MSRGSSEIVSAECRKRYKNGATGRGPTEIDIFGGWEKLGNQMHCWLQLSIMLLQWMPLGHVRSGQWYGLCILDFRHL